jgi:pilus assembly protein Flp/PilA
MTPQRLSDRDERGASAVEYGLLITGIAALICAIVFIFGGAVGGLFDETCDQIMVSAGPNKSC